MIEDDNVDAGRQEIVEYGEPAPPRSIPPQWRGAAIAVAAVALAGGAWFALRPSDAPSRVALAVPSGSIDTARANLARAGIACEFRGVALWVQGSDMQRAADAAICPSRRGSARLRPAGRSAAQSADKPASGAAVPTPP